MGLLTILIALGSALVAGLFGSEARAQSFERSSTTAPSPLLLSGETVQRDSPIRFDQGLRGALATEGEHFASRLIQSLHNPNAAFLLAPGQTFQFTTGRSPIMSDSLGWKHVYGMLGAYAMRHGRNWGATPGLTLTTGGRSSYLQASSFAFSGHLHGRSSLSFGMRF